jgi:hypothetical protein
MVTKMAMMAIERRIALQSGKGATESEVRYSFRGVGHISPLTDYCNSDSHESLGNQSVKIVSSI